LSIEEGLAHLNASDPALANLIRRVGPCLFEADHTGTHFESLLRSIVFQQLSGKAAATIFARVKALFNPHEPSPLALLALGDESLRAAGLSRAKLVAARSLAERILADPLPEDLSHLDDEAIVQALIGVKGIGRWSAQMFLMFRLGRPDVLPVADLGIQKALMRLDALERMPTPKELELRARPWRPYATLASWYLWRSLELPST
jgi:3-methyladenine DNA glycosylase/8-oxoguanine DNA glycosylase